MEIYNRLLFHFSLKLEDRTDSETAIDVAFQQLYPRSRRIGISKCRNGVERWGP